MASGSPIHNSEASGFSSPLSLLLVSSGEHRCCGIYQSCSITMTTSSFMDDYSSEDYEDCDHEYCFVPAVATQLVPQTTHPTDETQSNELQCLIIERQEVAPDSNLSSSESVYYEVLQELSNAVDADAAREAKNEIKESAAVVEADTTFQSEDVVKEGDVIQESSKAVEADANFEPEDAVEEGDVIEESSEAVEEDTTFASGDTVEEGDVTKESSEAVESMITTIATPATSTSLIPECATTLAVIESTGDSTVPVHDLETFMGCSPLVMLHECCTALISAIENFLFKVECLGKRLRRFISSLFRKWETSTKYA